MNNADNAKPVKSSRFNHNIASVLIAGLAVVLSQFPPLHTYFESSEVKISLPQKLLLQPNFNSGVIYGVDLKLNNVGAETSNVLAVQLIFERDDEVVDSILSDNVTPSDGNIGVGVAVAQTFTDFYIPPNSVKKQFYGFYKGNAKAEAELRVSSLFSQYLKEYQDWEVANGLDRSSFESGNFPLLGVDLPVYEMSDDLHDQLANSVHQKLAWWQVGEYKLSVVVYTKDEVVIESFNFSITKDTMQPFFTAMKVTAPDTFTTNHYEYLGFELGYLHLTLRPTDERTSNSVQSLTQKHHELIAS